MDRNGYAAVILILLLSSHICNASLGLHIRKLVAGDSNNTSATSQVAPSGSPVGESNSNPVNGDKTEKDKQNESQTSSQSNKSNNNETSPIASKDLKKNDSENRNSGDSNPAKGEKDIDKVDKGDGKAANANSTQIISNGSCKQPVTSCRDKELVACIEASKDGSGKLFLVLTNEGDSTLKVNVNLPNSLKNVLPAFQVPKHETKRVDISQVGKVTELVVKSGNAKCVLPLVNPISVDNFIQQFSFYSKQVTPIYAAYAFFLLALLFGGTWACCKLRKRSPPDGIPYQELEMGLPESASAGNVHAAAEGWDHDWDDDDWDEDSAVKSPGGHQIRNISADGLTIRSAKKDGWENDWES